MKHKKWYIIQGKTKIEKMLISFVNIVLHSTNINIPPKPQAANIDKITKPIGISDRSYILDPTFTKKYFLIFFVSNLLDINPIIGSATYVYPINANNAELFIGKNNGIKHVKRKIISAEQKILNLLKVQKEYSEELLIFSTVLLLAVSELKYASALSLLASTLLTCTFFKNITLFYQLNTKYMKNNTIKRRNNK